MERDLDSYIHSFRSDQSRSAKEAADKERMKSDAKERAKFGSPIEDWFNDEELRLASDFLARVKTSDLQGEKTVLSYRRRLKGFPIGVSVLKARPIAANFIQQGAYNVSPTAYLYEDSKIRLLDYTFGPSTEEDDIYFGYKIAMGHTYDSYRDTHWTGSGTRFAELGEVLARLLAP